MAIKKNEPLPEFIENIFGDGRLSHLEAHRERVKGGVTTPFSLYAPGQKLRHEEVCKWAQLNSISSKEAVANSFLDPNRFEENARRCLGCLGWQYY